MKMAVVGCEASGKTVFMCALADYYGLDAAKNPLRLKLTPENSAANSFERYQFRQMRTLHQWPLATPPERTIEMKWSLRAGGKALAYIDMLEFGGETFRAAFRDSDGDDAAKQDKSVKELLKYLTDSDFFVVLVSIKALLANQDNFNDDDFDRETEALWVTRGIIEFIRRRHNHAGIVIGLTQADKYRNELAEAGGPAQLLAMHWPTVASAAQDIQVVEVASVSKTDENGNPADGYHTHGILPVMKAFSKHCFGNENALENGAKRLSFQSALKRKLKIGVLVAILAGAVLAGVWQISGRVNRGKIAAVAPKVVEKVVEKVVTNKVTTVVERPITNMVEKIVKLQVTNTVEKVVKLQITNTVEKIVQLQVTNTVEKIVEKPVTNTVEKIIEKPVTNTIEKIVEKTVTNVVEKIIERPQPKGELLPVAQVAAPITVTNAVRPTLSDAEIQKQVPPGYRIWTDYNGRKIIAKWTGVAVDESGITIVTRYNRRIDAVLWKFSAEDQEYIRAEIKRHVETGEIMNNGEWVRNPLLKNAQ